MVFTFLGLTGSPYIRETNPLFAGYFATLGLVRGLILALLTNLIPAVSILALVHVLFYRPVIFYQPGHIVLGRKLVAVGGGLFLLTWGQKFFSDGYKDMTVLNLARIGSSGILWTVFLGCLCLYIAGAVFWGKILLPGFQAGETEGNNKGPGTRL